MGVSVLADLSKAFDKINYDLLLAKLHEHGFTNESLRTKVNTSFSSWSEQLLGVPQGSASRPLPFNIYLNDSFY